MKSKEPFPAGRPREYRIGELARLYGISPDTLRYYESLGFLSPKRRSNGYRVYAPEDIWKLNVIRDLRRLDFPIDKIRQFLEYRSVRTTLELLEEESAAVSAQIQELKTLQKNLEKRKENLKKSLDIPEGEILFRRYPRRSCIHIEEPFRQDAEADFLMQRLLNRSDSLPYIIGNNQLGSILPLKQVLKKDFQHYSSVFLIDPVAQPCNFYLEAGLYASVLYRGSYRRNAELIPRLLEEIRQKDMAPKGDVLELLWVDIHETADPREFVTELQIRVKEPKKGSKRRSGL